MICPKCKGSGKIREPKICTILATVFTLGADLMLPPIYRTCPKCNGKGNI